MPGNGSCSRIEPSHPCILFRFTTTTFTSPHPSTTTHHMDSTPIHQFSAPKGEFLEPPQSSQPIKAPGYQLRPGFIAMVRDQSFSGHEDENPYTHLREFEHLYSCLHIEGMEHETIKWKLFPFSLLGRAKKWYAHTVGGVNGNWDKLRDNFCLTFFPYSQIGVLCIEILTFR